MTDQPQTPQSAPSLQDTVMHLQWFWAAQNCLLLPPCDFEVPFATLHPDAFFRLLDPGPWRAAYLQPVRRPLDARYGRHPYRLGKHLQLQVVLKPPPPDVQSLYLESLEALGLELALHDLRFTEWRWQPRSLGARGSGWHAQLNGLGVTRMTFLDRIAGRDLDPVAVELSYGLERLVMTLQGAASAFELDWSGSGTDYGRLRQRDEEELSRYAFEVADVAGLRRRLEALDEEAGRCLEAGLSRPAYELAVRCLKLIDLLEARGDLSARQRAHRLERVHQRVVAIADLDSTRGAPAGKQLEDPPAVGRKAAKRKRRKAKPADSKDGSKDGGKDGGKGKR